MYPDNSYTVHVLCVGDSNAFKLKKYVLNSEVRSQLLSKPLILASENEQCHSKVKYFPTYQKFPRFIPYLQLSNKWLKRKYIKQALLVNLN